MTLHPQHAFSIPEETVRVARAAYPKGNLYLKMRDSLGTIYQDQSFAQLFPQNGRPVEAHGGSRSSPWCSFWKGFLIDKQQRQCADGLT